MACLLVCAGLAWMHVEMKKDLETLRTGLSTGNRIKLCCTIFVDVELFCCMVLREKSSCHSPVCLVCVVLKVHIS